MTVHHHVVAVIDSGEFLPAERIDELKTQALKELEDMPISHAKASGKFGFDPLPDEHLKEDGK